MLVYDVTAHKSTDLTGVCISQNIPNVLKCECKCTYERSAFQAPLPTYCTVPVVAMQRRYARDAHEGMLEFSVREKTTKKWHFLLYYRSACA